MSLTPRSRVELYYSSRLGGEPQGIVFTPGRIVLLGEHVDHQGGPVLAVPHPKGVYVAWGVRPDRKVALHSLNARATDAFSQDGIVRSGRRWADLARGACARLGEAGKRLPGLNLVVYGNLPPRRGLASSAAYVTGILRAALTATGAEMNPATLARDVAAIERDWAGVPCGFMDPYVEIVGEPGRVVHLDNESLTHEILPLPKDTSLEAEYTGIQRRLDRTPYAERRRELEQAFTAVRRSRPELESLVDLTPDVFAALEEELEEPLRQRTRHVVSEVHRVREAVYALRAGDAKTLGKLMWKGHRSLARDFACSLPQIDEQVLELKKVPNVLGARLQGAGWGGSIAVLRRTT